MHTYRFELSLKALLLASSSYPSGTRRAASDGYMSSLEQNLPWPAQKKGDLILPMLSWALAC